MCCLGTYSACQSLDTLFYWRYQENNKWLGQCPGNKESVIFQYHDCKCQFHDLSKSYPNCIYLTMEDINYAKKGNGTIKMLELNITAQFPCMKLEMHLLKRVFHYLTIHGP